MTPAEALSTLDALDSSYRALDGDVRACMASPIQSGFPVDVWNGDLARWRAFRDGPLASTRRRQLDPEGLAEDIAPYAASLLIQRQTIERFCAHVMPQPEPALPDYLTLADDYVPPVAPTPAPSPVRVRPPTVVQPVIVPIIATTAPAPRAPSSGSGLAPFLIGGAIAGIGALVWKGMRRGTSR